MFFPSCRMLDCCVTLYLFSRAFVTIITTCFLVSSCSKRSSKDLIFVIKQVLFAIVK